MKRAAVGLLLASLAVGTWSDTAPAIVPRVVGGYQVLAADFHVHSFPFSWGTLSPWDTVIEARRRALDVVALTPHNHIWVAQLGRWFSETFGGPLVLVGEEIVSPDYHLLGIGLEETVSPHQSAAAAIDAVHRQGGVAIAAHPYESFWPAYDEAALAALDGAEVVRPEVQSDDDAAGQLREFFGRASLAAIGSSDYHGIGFPGFCRTFVFATEWSASGVIEAVRSGRTVVYDRGRAYGDPALIALAFQEARLDPGVSVLPTPGFGPWFSRMSAVVALAMLLLTSRS